ncbi:hypothetical protein [Sphingorhabdus sp.]|jgi:hypothetical protein|uniref:hypothetical protein n=1 Tax=Sphingorhabdus sp. TaxID=1902408 RepID=UPI0037C96B93
MKKPTIPMSALDLPEQRIVSVANLVDRPDPFNTVVGWNEKPTGVMLANGPRNADYLGQVEWAWGPMNGRVDGYYLSRGRSHWMLWVYAYDDNDGWTWCAIGHAPLKQASRNQAMIHLLADFWRWEKENNELEHYSWINEEDCLNASELRTIALLVWNTAPEGGGKDE